MGVPGSSSSRTSAISRFLEEHQDHEGGFDVGREPASGTGRLRIVCLGCGESVEYRAAENGPVGHEDTEPRRSSRQGRLPPRRPAAGRSVARGFRKSPYAPIGLVILIAALLLAAILLLTGNGSDHSIESTTTTPEPRTVATQPAAPETSPQPKPEPRAPRLHAASFDGQFGIGVPGGWRTERRGSETVLLGPGGTPETDVYYAQDSRDMTELGSSAVRFLHNRHTAGHIVAPIPTRVADLPALRVVATYPTGSETAVVLRSGAYAYLLVKRITRGDDPYRVRQAAAALDSFRPL